MPGREDVDGKRTPLASATWTRIGGPPPEEAVHTGIQSRGDRSGRRTEAGLPSWGTRPYRWQVRIEGAGPFQSCLGVGRKR